MYDPRPEQTLKQVLRKRAERCGDKPWIITADETISYRDMDARSNRLARGFAEQGITPGETVLLMLPDTPAIITCWCALAKLGTIEVSVNTHLRGNVLSHIINNSSAKTLVIDSRFLDRIEAAADSLETLERIVLHTEAGESSVRELPPKLGSRMQALQLEKLFAQCDEALDDPGPAYHDLIAVMYTSGTTGSSKGVMITHAHAYEYSQSAVELLELKPHDIYYSPLPLFHIAGQWAAVYASCIAECAVVLPAAFSLSSFWQDVCRYKATCTFLLGAMTNWLYRQPPADDDADNPMERMLIVPLLPEIEDFKQRFDVLVSTTWGSTEISCPTRSGFNLANSKTCGYVTEDRYEVRIVDEHDQELPPGVPGEATVRSKEPWIIMAGYWNNPQATATAWRNQWVHTGDMLMRDEQGNLYFVDRTKDAIRRRGENISSMEVENEINAYPAVVECAVVPVDSADSEQEVMAVLVLNDNAAFSPSELIRFLEPRMAHFMVPRYIDTLEQLPKTQTGKIRKFVLRDRGLTNTTWDREQAGIKLKRQS